MAIHVVIFPRVEMESDFYYIKVKVIFPKDGVVKEFDYGQIQSFYLYHYNCFCISNTFCFGWTSCPDSSVSSEVYL